MKDERGVPTGAEPVTNGDATVQQSAPLPEIKPVEARAHGDRQTIIKMLNDALGTEMASFLRYRRHHFASPSAGGIAGFAIAGVLLKHSQEELAHSDRLAARITQLGGQPDLRLPAVPGGVQPRNDLSSLRTMLTEDLSGKRLAVSSYATFIRIVAASDPTSRRVFEDILAQEEAHVVELEDFLRQVQVVV